MSDSTERPRGAHTAEQRRHGFHDNAPKASRQRTTARRSVVKITHQMRQSGDPISKKSYQACLLVTAGHSGLTASGAASWAGFALSRYHMPRPGGSSLCRPARSNTQHLPLWHSVLHGSLCAATSPVAVECRCPHWQSRIRNHTPHPLLCSHRSCWWAAAAQSYHPAGTRCLACAA